MAESSQQVRGFQVRYQAVGSHVLQYSAVLSSSTFSHHITRLHENTDYQVCVNVLYASVDPQVMYRRPRYDAICYFNVRSKADMSQPNLPHGTNS